MKSKEKGKEAIIPKSMSVGERNVVRSNDSLSLWNFTISPGWTKEQAAVLRKALLIYGIGNWRDIYESECLPGKTILQLNLQTQRMLGQQSTAEFQGLHIDPLVIGKLNSVKRGHNIKRKNGYIINNGSKLSKQEKLNRINENKKYEWPEHCWKSLFIPTNKESKLLFNNDKTIFNEESIDGINMLLIKYQSELNLLNKELSNVKSWINNI